MTRKFARYWLCVLVALAALPLSAASFTSSASGNWSSSSTWGGAGVPGAGDFVTVNHVITLDVDVTVNTLTMNNSITGAHSLTVTNTMQWNGGTLGGGINATIPNGATLSLLGYGAVDASTLNINGSFNATSSYYIYLQNSSSLVNGGTIDFQGDNGFYVNGGTDSVTNNGTFKKSGGTGTATINVPLTATSGSQFLVQSGSFNVGAVTASSATFSASSGATMTFNTNDTRTFDAASTISGAGTVVWSSGTNTVSGTYSVTGNTTSNGGTTTISPSSVGALTVAGGTLTLNGASALSVSSLTMSGGVLTGTLPISVTGLSNSWSGGTISGSGTMTLPVSGTTNITFVILDGRPITNNGTIALVSNGTLYLENNAVLTNAGTIDFQSDGNLYLNSVAGTTAVVNNGTIQKSVGTSNSTFNVPLTANSGSQFLVQTGNVYGGAVTSSGATFSISSGAAIVYNTSDSRTFDATSTITGAGSVQWASGTNVVNGSYNIGGTTQNSAATTTLNNIASVGNVTMTGGTLTLNGAGAVTVPTLTMQGGTLNGTAPINVTSTSMSWSNGTLGGSGTLTIPNGTTISLSFVVLDGRPLTNNGIIDIVSNGTIYVENNAVLTNAGTIDIQSDGNIYLNSVAGSTAIVNNGVIKKSAGTSNTTVNVPLIANSGSQFLVQSGNVYGGAVTSTGATFSVSSGAMLGYNTGDTRTFDAATTISGAGTVQWSAGTNSVSAAYNITGATQNTGATTTISNITSVGNVSVSGGTLSLNGASAISVPTLTMTGGALSGTAPINLTATSMTWSGGTITGSGLLTIPNTTTITLTFIVLDTRAVTNNGVIDIVSSGTFYIQNNAVLTNSGTIDYQSDGNIYLNSVAGTTAVINSGTITKSAGAASGSRITVPLTMQSGSQFVLTTGQLLYIGDVTSTGGTFSVASNAVLFFYYTNTASFDAASTISGAGTVRWGAGTNTVNGTYNITGTTAISGGATTLNSITSVGPLSIDGGTLTLNSASAISVPSLSTTAGVLSGTAPITITGSSMSWMGGTIGGSGALSVPNNATVTITQVILDTRQVTNAGTWNLISGYNLYLQNNATIVNNGTIDIQADNGVYPNSAIGSISITNNGTIKKSGGTNGSVFDIPLIANSGSQFLVQSSLVYIAAVTSSGATFNVASGTTLDFYYSDTRTFDAATTISGSGTLESQGGTTTISGSFGNPILLAGGTLTLNSASALSIPTLNVTAGTLSGTAAINLTGAAMTWAGGTIGGSGTISIPAPTTLTTNGIVIDGRPISNAGTMNVSAGTFVYVMNNAVLTNSGTIDVQGDGGVYLNSVAGTTAVVSSGTIKKSGGTGISYFTVALTANSGSQFLGQSGTFYVGAVTATSATFSVSSGATISFATGDTRTFDAATTISGAGTTAWQGGSNTVSGTLSTNVNLGGGTLTLNSASAQSIPTLTLNGGTLAGSAAINLTGAAMTWTYGTIGGSSALTIPNGTTVTINAYPTFDARPVTNNGSIVLTTANNVTLQNGAVLTNNGTIDLQADAGIYAGTGGGTIINNATFKKSGGSTGSSMTAAFTAHSGSQLLVQSSILYAGLITSTGATTTISSGATLAFYYGGNSSFDATSTIGGAGSVVVYAGVNTVSGTISTPITLNGATLAINSAAAQSIPTLTLNGGTFDGSAAVNLTGTSMTWTYGTITGNGTLTIPSGTTVTVNGFPTFDTRAVTNNGTMLFTTANTVTMQNGAVLTNNGTINIQADAAFSLNGSASIVNNGTFEKTAGTGSSLISVPFTANSGSQFLQQSGTIYAGPITGSGAALTVSSGATFIFYYGGSSSFDASSTIGGSGSVQWQGGTTTFAGTLSAPTTINGGTLTINSASAQTLPSLTMQSGTLNGSGAVTVGSGSMTWTGGVIGGSGAFTLGSGTNITQNGYVTFDGRPVTNGGTYAVGSSYYVSLQNNASLTNNGTFTFSADGTIYLSAGNASITNNGTLSKSGGTGTSYIYVPTTNAAAGTITAASGTLQFLSTLTQSGTLYFPIAGATSFGVIGVSGALPLGGTLTVTTTNGYAPSNGTAFQILNYGSKSGVFANKNLDYASGTFTETYSATNLTVTAGPQALGITGVSPNAGTSAGGTTVTISGVDFASGATVTFGGTAATSVTFNNSTSLTAVTPAHAIGLADVVVTNPTTQAATLTNGYLFTGLVSHYTFDVNGTPGKDVAGSNDATSVTNVTQTSGKVGNAGSFASGWMDLPQSSSLNLRSSDFTLEAFVNSAASTNLNWFTKSTNAGPQQYGIGTSGNTKALFSFDAGSGGSVTSTTNIFDGTWHHVAAVKRGANAEIWVDGVLEASGAVSGSLDTGTFAIGRDGACCDSFNGLIDEAKIYNYALSSSEIRSDASATDLAISKSAPASVTAGQTITWTITVTNNGPLSATNVSVSDTLPATTSFVSATPSQGTCSGTATVTCGLNTIANGGTATITIVANANSAGNVTNTATVSATESDPVSSNNSASAATVVNSPTCNAPTVTASGPTTFCAGSSVTLTATASGAIGFQWSNASGPINGATSANFVATASGNYSVTATYSNCSATSTATAVTVNPAPPTPVITPSGATSFCQGGSVNLTAPAGYTYAWSNAATTQTITVSASGNYSVTVFDANGCSATSAPTAVTVNPLPNATITAPSSVCSTGSGNASVAVASGAATYNWTATNANITAGAGTNAITFAPSNGSPITLNVTITDGNGCTASGTANVSVGAFTPSITPGGPTTFCAGGSVTLTATSGSSYLWSDNETTQSIVVTASGNYSVTVTSGGCSGTSAAATVTVNPNPTATITAGGPTNFCQGGSVVLTASAGASYLWSTGATTQSITATASGSYGVTVTSNGCSTTSAATTVTVHPLPNATISAPSSVCATGSGNATVGTVSGGSYNWSATNANITNGGGTNAITFVPTGSSTITLNVTITDGAGCSASGTSSVAVGSVTPTITASGPTTFCAGGSVTLTASAGTSYLWSTGATTQSISVTTGGSYSVTVTSGSCSGTSAATNVTVNPAPSAVITAGGPTTFCPGGSVTLTASAASSYLWSTGATTQSITTGSGGSYSVTVTGANGCSATSAATTVTIRPLPNATITAPASVCATGSGNASVAALSGATYNWTATNANITAGAGTNAITFAPTGSSAITLNVTVTDTNGCTAGSSANVSVGSFTPSITVSGATTFCQGGSVTLTATSGSSYLWSDGETTQSIVVSSSGNYSVTVTSGGCSGTSPATTVTVNQPPSVSISAPSAVCANSSGNAASATVVSGASYSWSVSGGTLASGQGTSAITFNAGASGSVNLSVIVNASGCSANASHAVPIAASGSIAINAPPSAVVGSTGNSASVAAGPAGTTYAWTISGGSITAGQGTASITWSASGSGTSATIGVTVTSGNCSATGSATVSLSGSADLSISIAAPPSVNAGDPFSYLVTITNNGPTTAKNVTVTDTLPAGVAFGSASGSGWSCSGGAGSVTCTAGLVSAATSTAITINVTAPSQAGSITDSATVSATTTDPNGANNGASATTQVVVPAPQCNSVPASLTAPDDGATALLNPITLTWTSVPNATAYDVQANGSIVATTTSTLASLNFPSGSVTWFVTARFGNGCPPLSSASRSFSVAQAVNCNHGVAQLIAPAPGATVASPVTFQWTAVAEAVNYRVWVAIDGGAPQDLGLTGGATTLSAPLSGSNVVWSVEALFSGCPSTSSATSSFVIPKADPCANHGSATLTAPADKSVASSSLQFSWNAVANAGGYRVWTKINNAADFTEAGETKTETTLSATISSGSVEWYVQTLFDGCASTESSHFTFTIPAAQSCPTTPASIVAPANGASLTSTSVPFSWNAAPNAIHYEVWIALGGASPSLLDTTTSTSLTHEVPAGALEWFVRASFNGCAPLDSPHAAFTVTPPANCPQQRPLLSTPADGDKVISPASFTWSAVPQATKYGVFLATSPTPTLLGTTTSTHLDSQTLQPGAVDWYVEASFGDGCAPTRSAAGSFSVVAPPPPCAPPVAPAPRATSSVSSNVEYVISWNRIGNAAFYEYEESASPAFIDANPSVTYADHVTFQHANNGNAPLSYFFRVRMVSTCESARSLYSPTIVVVILPSTETTGATPADDPQNITYTLNVPAQPGQTFSASGNQPWISVTPSSGTATSDSISLTVTANTSGLPVGTSSGAVTVVFGGGTGSGKLGTHGSSSATTTVNVNLVQPTSPSTKNAPPPDALIIPAVAHADGINSKFQSDIRVTNTAPDVKKYQLTFTPSGDAGIQSGKQATVSIDPGATLALDDILSSWFGSQGAIGTLEIRPSSTTTSATSPSSPSSSSTSGVPSITTFAASRTYNTTPNGTFGQFIPAIPFSQFVGSKGSVLTLQQVAQSQAFRTNVGLVEGAGEPATVLLSVFGDDGAKLAEFTQALTAGQHIQMNGLLAAHNLSVNDGRIEVRVTSAGGKVTAYASVVDNATNDPLLVSPVAVSSLGATKWVIPGVADLSNGAANWRSDVRLFNAGTDAVNATLTYVPQGGGDPIVKTMAVAPNEVKQLDGIVQNLFGLTNSGGALHITTENSAPLVATARTYNQTANGTYGQFIPAVTPNDAVGKGQRALQILQVEESDRYRSNIGIAEVTGKPATVEITAVPPDSKFAVTTQTTLNPNEFRQYGSLIRSLGLGDTYNARITVRVVDGDGRVTAYASVIDQKTQDPTFVPAQ